MWLKCTMVYHYHNGVINLHKHIYQYGVIMLLPNDAHFTRIQYMTMPLVLYQNIHEATHDGIIKLPELSHKINLLQIQ